MAVISANTLANGLRTEFTDTYSATRKDLQDSRLGLVMDLGIGATNRQHEFAYYKAAPHMEFWRRGDGIPTDAFASVQFTTPVHEWAIRVPWSKWDREDDQTDSLYDLAKTAGTSSALLAERFFFDLLTGATNTLPFVPLAPDGAAFFATQDGNSVDRFGVTDGNLLSISGIASISDILADYYAAIEQFKLFQDGKGQPLFRDDIVDGGAVVIHAAEDTYIMEQAFKQIQQAVEITSGANGTAASQSNIVQDSGRSGGITLWGTQRVSSGEWYVLLKRSPKKPTFLLDRQGVKEFSALGDDNNSDHVRDYAEEYVQWEMRAGAGIALPYGAIKIA